MQTTVRTAVGIPPCKRKGRKTGNIKMEAFLDGDLHFYVLIRN